MIQSRRNSSETQIVKGIMANNLHDPVSIVQKYISGDLSRVAGHPNIVERKRVKVRRASKRKSNRLRRGRKFDARKASM